MRALPSQTNSPPLGIGRILVPARTHPQAIGLRIDELPASVISGIEPVVNRLWTARRAFVQPDNRFVRRFHAVSGKRKNRGDELLSAVGVLRKDLDDIPVGLAVGELEYIRSGGKHFSRNFQRSGYFQTRLFVPLIRHRRSD